MQRSLPFPLAAPSQEATGFYRETLFHPFATGAIAPTSAGAARELVRRARVASAAAIFELGSGGGAITKEILRAMPPGARLFALERNPSLAGSLHHRFPRARILCGCASRLREHAAAQHVTQVDSMISTLPWTLLSSQAQQNILAASAELLAPDGTFATLMCLGLQATAKGRHFRESLHRAFPHVEPSPIIWRNFPPVIVYSCHASGVGPKSKV